MFCVSSFQGSGASTQCLLLWTLRSYGAAAKGTSSHTFKCIFRRKKLEAEETFFATRILQIYSAFIFSLRCFFSPSSAWSLCERNGSVAVYATTWGGFQKPGWGMLSSAEPRRWPHPAELPQQKLRGHGPHPWAEGEAHMWARLNI